MRGNQGWFWLKPRHWIPCSARLCDSAAWCQAWVAWEVKIRIFNGVTLQATNISPTKTLLKTVFLFQRWNLLVSWRVLVNQAQKLTVCASKMMLGRWSFPFWDGPFSREGNWRWCSSSHLVVHFASHLEKKHGEPFLIYSSPSTSAWIGDRVI